jgi:DNA (cytosine-5)-methyltransferase 1
MRHGSLFSGIGGFDLAAEWMGWENVFQVEWDGFCQKVLAKNFPNVKRYGDIKEFDGTKYRGLIDIISGGFPCQPYSLAGKRKGKADDRHLWPEMLRTIREIQPDWVVPENVPGIINWSGGLVFEEVQADLEAEGYEILPLVLPAVGRGAIHRRRRVWFVAHTTSNGYTRGCQETRRKKRQGEQRRMQQFERSSSFTTYAESLRVDRKKKFKDNYKQGGEWRRCDVNNNGEIRQGNGDALITNSGYQGLQRREDNRIIRESREKQEKQFTRFICSNWDNFPTQSPLCGRDDGLPNRVDRIKGLGNAIVPQVVYQIFKAIEEYEYLRP